MGWLLRMWHIDQQLCLKAMSLQAGRSVNCPTCRVKVPVREMAYVHAAASNLQAQERDKDGEPSETDMHVEGSYGTKVSCLTFLVTSNPQSLLRSQRKHVAPFFGHIPASGCQVTVSSSWLAQPARKLSSSDIAEFHDQYNLHEMQNSASLALHLVQ